MLDILQSIATYPIENSEQIIANEQLVVGGACGRAILTAVRLGLVGGVTGMIGTGLFARVLREAIANEGMLDHLFENPNALNSQHALIISVESTASRTVFWLRQPTASSYVAERMIEHVDQADAILIDCSDMTLAYRIAQHCRRKNKLTVVDTGSYKPGVEDVLPYIDYVVVPEKFLRAATGATSELDLSALALQYFKVQKLRSLVVTCGSRGGLIVDGGKAIGYNAVQSVAVDTCGAGDSFRGGLLVGLLEGWDLGDSVKFAAWVASQKCSVVGNGGLPTRSRANVWMSTTL